MRETRFIEQNKDKWVRYENALKHDKQDPDLLSELYVHTTDDLSYSRTFYKNRSVRVYLNDLARRTFLKVYKGRRGESSRFFTFWTDELPRISYRRRFELRLSLILFLLSMVVGVVSYLINPEFAELILSDGYMELTRDNIAAGDPMAIYKSSDAFGMFLRITLNNIQVALLAFALGAFLGLGTAVVLVSNGIMLGVFQFFFMDQGLFWESFCTVYLHGAIEISSIVIAGAAGFVMGGGILFPGTLSRGRSFALAAREAVKMMIGIIPLFIIAGFLESYLTRHYQEISIELRWVFILTCFGFIIWYYVIYPIRVVRRGPPESTPDDRRLSGRETQAIKPHTIKMMGELYGDVFSWLWKRGPVVFGWLFLIGILFCAAAFNFTGASPGNRYVFESNGMLMFYNFYALLSTFGFDREPGYVFLIFSSLFAIQYVVFWLLGRDFDLRPTGEAPWKPALRLLFPTLLITAMASLGSFAGSFFFWLSLPILIMYGFSAYFKLGGIGRAFTYALGYLSSSYGLAFLLVLFGFVISLFFDTVVSSFVFTFLSWVISPDLASIDDYNNIILAVLFWGYFSFIFCLLCIGLAFGYLSIREQREANSFLEEVEQVGQQKQIRGLAAE
ncbi:MAG: stage II sporulation protein M [Bacteroidota bacterium]